MCLIVAGNFPEGIILAKNRDTLQNNPVELVHEMMENDINIAKRDLLIKEHGFKAPDFNE